MSIFRIFSGLNIAKLIGKISYDLIKCCQKYGCCAVHNVDEYSPFIIRL